MISKLSKQITISISFHDVELYPELILVKYNNGYTDCVPWLISKEGYLKLKDTQEAQDPDFWIDNHSSLKDEAPHGAMEIFLVDESFLNNPKRFWNSRLDLIVDYSTEDSIKTARLYPVYLDIYNHQVFDLNKKLLRLPLIFDIYLSYFCDDDDSLVTTSSINVEKIKEHLMSIDEVINVEFEQSAYFSSSRLWVTIKTNNLPIDSKQKITQMSFKDRFLWNEDRFNLNQFKIKKNIL